MIRLRITGRGAASLFLVAVGTTGCLLHPGQASGGNLEMVEKNVEELENWNRGALDQIQGVPRDGKVDLKAYVTLDGAKQSIRIDQKKITSRDSTRPSGQEKPASTDAELPATPTDGNIEYLEKNLLKSSPTIKADPGGRHVR